MSNIMHHQILCSFVERVVNALLTINQADNAPLVALEQKTIVISLAELDFPMSFTFNEQQLLVTCITERSDCHIETSLATLKKLQTDQQLTDLIKQDKLNISGDIKIAQQFSSIFQQLDIDWQSELATFIGDVPTYKVVKFNQWLLSKFAFAKQQITADATEWLLHEKRLLVANDELQQLYSDIQATERNFQHLERRIIQLENALKKHEQEQSLD
ncbi:ubiquinone biosynthesis accessory factor UbiJ [Thalassotalea sediminis]|uniref:ubiquinone biosynthesis accessory factor UbiJ n=1 Tax=Thalassotalea sediminis TaxID=1759089 RepID=UPI002573732F|nr:SCP2 sterol-binding domain-containing protein [Thalassotalea sediminis]